MASAPQAAEDQPGIAALALFLAAFELGRRPGVSAGKAADHLFERALDRDLLAGDEQIGIGAGRGAHERDEVGIDGDLAAPAPAHHDQSRHLWLSPFSAEALAGNR